MAVLRRLTFLFLVLSFTPIYAAAADNTADEAVLSTLTGRVYDRQRNPLPDVDVELLDDLYRVMMNGRTKTDSSGRYQFNGLSNGNYTIRVFAFRYDLEDQSIPFEINTQNIRGGEGSGYFTQDFFLSPKRGSLAAAETGTVFAQEVPDEAKRLYGEALKEFEEKRQIEGVNTLNRAINLFPKYYDALYRAGREMYILGRYREAVPYFLRAIEVNEKSAYTLYYLGNCFYFMGKDFYKASQTALAQSAILAPGSAQVFYSLGRTQRAMGNFADAEKNLQNAKRNSKLPVAEIQRELSQLYANDMKKFGEAADELELYLKASGFVGKEAEDIKIKIADLRKKAGKKTE